MTYSLSQISNTIEYYTPEVVSQGGACLYKYIFRPVDSSVTKLERKITHVTGISNPIIILFLSFFAISYIALIGLGANLLYQEKKLRDFKAQIRSAIQNGRSAELEKLSQNPLAKKVHLHKLQENIKSNNHLSTIRVLLKNFTSTPSDFSGLLKKAIDEKHVDIARVVAEVIAEKNFEDHDLFDFIWSELRGISDDHQEFRDILVSISPNIQDRHGNTFLHRAFETSSDYPKVGIVRYLLSRDDVDPNILNNFGKTPLLEGLNSRELQGNLTKFSTIIPLFLAKEDLTFSDEDVRKLLTPYKAINYEEIVEALYARENLKIDINVRDSHGKTPLHQAVEQLNLDAVRLLIKRGAEVDARDNRGNTPLHLVARKAASYIHSQTYFDYIKTLLDNRADPTIQNNEGTIPYQTAGKNYSVKRLLETSITDKTQRMNFVIEAVRRNHHQEIVLLLHATDYIDDPRLLKEAFTAPVATPEVIFTLLQKQALFEPQQCRTLFMEALNSGKFGVCLAVKAFMEETGEERDDLGNSHYHFAAQKSDPIFLLLLDNLDNNSGLDEKNNNGDTPLILALRNGYFKTAQALIDRGANTNGVANEIMQNPELMQVSDTAIHNFLQQFNRTKAAF